MTNAHALSSDILTKTDGMDSISATISENNNATKERHDYLKHILQLAAVGVIAFNGSYHIDVKFQNDTTPAIASSVDIDNTVAGVNFYIPVAKYEYGLFGDLSGDPLLDSYYKNARFFEADDILDA